MCAELREVRIDKNQKPYVVCDFCGVQLFIRGKQGIKRLDALIEVSGGSTTDDEDEGRLFEDK